MSMVQDLKTGRFELPEGRHLVQGKMSRDNLYDNTRCIYGSKRGNSEQIEQSFQGEIVRDSSKVLFSFGMDLVVGLDEEDVYEYIEPTGTTESEKNNEIIKVVPFVNERNRQLKNWIRHQGGMLAFQAHVNIDEICQFCDDEIERTVDATYKLKLYTVLSVHIPNADPVKADKGHEVDWAFLEKAVAARFPKKGLAWAKRGVSQYMLFLDLKIAKKDWKSTKFSPSGPIDEIWHTHISFTERYQQDVHSLTGNKHLIEHTPVLKEDSMKRYVAARNEHVEQMKKIGQAVDPEFWPAPVIAIGESSDDGDDSSVDSDARLDIGYAPSCG